MRCWIDFTEESCNVELITKESCDAELSLFLWRYASGRHGKSGYAICAEFEAATIDHLHAQLQPYTSICSIYIYIWLIVYKRNTGIHVSILCDIQYMVSFHVVYGVKQDIVTFSSTVSPPIPPPFIHTTRQCLLCVFAYRALAVYKSSTIYPI